MNRYGYGRKWALNLMSTLPICRWCIESRSYEAPYTRSHSLKWMRWANGDRLFDIRHVVMLRRWWMIRARAFKTDWRWARLYAGSPAKTQLQWSIRDIDETADQRSSLRRALKNVGWPWSRAMIESICYWPLKWLVNIYFVVAYRSWRSDVDIVAKLNGSVVKKLQSSSSGAPDKSVFDGLSQSLLDRIHFMTSSIQLTVSSHSLSRSSGLPNIYIYILGCFPSPINFKIL